MVTKIRLDQLEKELSELVGGKATMEIMRQMEHSSEQELVEMREAFGNLLATIPAETIVS